MTRATTTTAVTTTAKTSPPSPQIPRLQPPVPSATGGSHFRRLEPIVKLRERGVDWGTDVALAVLAWRATDGFAAAYPSFPGGTAVGQWRPTPPGFVPMSSQGLAFTAMFVLDSNTQFRPGPPRALTSPIYTDDFNAVKALGRKIGSTRTAEQTALAPFWAGR